MQLKVTANKLNKRSSVPLTLADKNIVGIVLKGFQFEGEEVRSDQIPNPALGKWYRDLNGSYYWGGGLLVTAPDPVVAPALHVDIPGLPQHLPENYQLGIDLSHHNDKPDWPAIKAAGISFCFIKISEGVGTRDKKAQEHASNAKANGLKVGYYHFCRPDTRNGGTVISDATAEANEVLDTLKSISVKSDLPLVLDLEDQQNWDTPLNQKDYLKWINTFISGVSGTFPSPIIYSRKNYLDEKLPSAHNLGGLKLWIANYSQKDCNRVVCANGWPDWAIWQYTESGKIGGNLKLDINIWKGGF